ncbi:MAG TPA: hypothetical protein VE465_19715 [Streptosporangiaceae bacterium]|nr:hypothetical protein [Streptosporangiaceae bacterium]
MGGFGSARTRVTVITLVAVLVLGIGMFAAYRYVKPYLHGSGCRADTEVLDLEQAANAATIAIVAAGEKLPERALVIAYATAEQESHIRNLEFGDLDSVGLFQQRPSQGWGAKERLMDPVYASRRFFAALAKVKDYRRRSVADAAQRVQRSADGSAYARHVTMAQTLAAAYIGRRAMAVRCWFTPGRRTQERRAAALRELRRTFGPGGPPIRGDFVAVGSPREGWMVAAWAVSHAQAYGLTEIRYAGRQWTADNGHAGWTKDTKAPADRVLIK